MVRAPNATAADAIGTLTSGCRVFGLTRGQFSLIDIVRAILDQTGPADLIISTWTTGIKDLETAEWLVEQGLIRSLRFMTDRSFVSRQPRYAAAMTRKFGSDAISATLTHAKFAVIQNEEWALALRSSMNLNRNPRYEQFDLDDSPALCAFLVAFCDEVSAAAPSLTFDNAEIEAAFREVMDGGPWQEAGAGGAADLRKAVALRLTDAELSEVAAAAARDRMPVGAWLREVVRWAAEE